jgi:agmatine deiminase
MPAEWAPHRGTWLSWPHRESSWPGKFAPVPGAFAQIVRHLVPHEEVHINVAGSAMATEVSALLQDAGAPVVDLGPAPGSARDAGRGRPPSPRSAPPSRRAVYLHHNPTNDAWCRDHGPIFVQRQTASGRKEEAIIDWGYNAWGGKYPPFEADDVIPSRIAAHFGLPVFHPGIVMEGGSLDVNGRGTLLTTESCLLNPNRNPTLSREQIEQRLRDFLGVTHILWLGGGIEGDDTDGHVDDLTRFVDEHTVVTAVDDDPRDANYAPLRENLERLRSMRDQDGRPLRVVPLPMPPAMHHDGQRLPASYANFYIANEVVLLPAYHPPTDQSARDTLQHCFPTRRVVPVDSRDLVWGLGSFHCVTQQWPAL